VADQRKGVLILYNLPRAGDGASDVPCPESDAGVLDEVEGVAEALTALGVPFRRSGVRRLSDVASEVTVAPETTVFNLVESLAGDAQDFNLVPALCRAFGKASTGSDTPCLLQCLDKWRTKAVLRAAGVPTPRAVVVSETDQLPQPVPPGPLIVKPVQAEASEGIGKDSVFREASPPLWDAVRRVQRLFGGSALIEQFIDGREVNVSLLERGGELLVLPLAEIEFVDFPPGRPRIVDYPAKWLVDTFEYRNTVRRIPTSLPEAVADRVRRYARTAWQALGCRDYARVDFRLDEKLRPYVLEVNANPDISPGAGFAAALAAGGISFAEFVETTVRNALARLPSALPSPPTAPAAEPSIRWSQPEERDAILAIVAQTGAFRPEEVAVAREVLDAALSAGPDGQYQSYTALAGGGVVGWVCFGPTPCTQGTFDLYWLAVDPHGQGRGIGTALVSYVERMAVLRGGRMMIVETAGREAYDAARRFYRKLGYEEHARLTDFYAPSDDKVVYVKRLGP
jgi:D-alanine-D-alanine ligase-like ATP-grasp enzyme/ribosomal protein S18 acetylase RimI-like enzyme